MIASAAKNRRLGRTGYSPRALVFGLDDRLVASNLNHFLEEPDDASVEAHKTDPTLNKARQLCKIAMKAVIELDHSDKWAAACKYPSRPAETNLFLPGHQVMFWRKQTARKQEKRLLNLVKLEGRKFLRDGMVLESLLVTSGTEISSLIVIGYLMQAIAIFYLVLVSAMLKSKNV